MVGADLQITHFIARTQIWIPTQLCTSLPVWLVHNRFPDSVPCTVDGGSGKSPEYFVTISPSSPGRLGSTDVKDQRMIKVGRGLKHTFKCFFFPERKKKKHLVWVTCCSCRVLSPGWKFRKWLSARHKESLWVAKRVNLNFLHTCKRGNYGTWFSCQTKLWWW